MKLQVSFAKETYKRDYILQKRPIILRSLLIVATPYHLSSIDSVLILLLANATDAVDKINSVVLCTSDRVHTAVHC